MLFRSGHQDLYAAAERLLQLAHTTIALKILHGRSVEQGDGSILSSMGGWPHGCFQQNTSTPASVRGSPHNRSPSSTSTSRGTASRGTASGWYVPGGAIVCHHHGWGGSGPGRRTRWPADPPPSSPPRVLVVSFDLHAPVCSFPLSTSRHRPSNQT